MMTTTDEIAAKLREAAEKATPGPWGTDAEGPTSGYGQKASIGVFSELKLEAALDNGDDEENAMSDSWLLGIWGEISDEDRANATYIALANPASILALLEERESRQWQPIETAPRNGEAWVSGKDIDLWHKEQGRVANCFWRKEYKAWFARSGGRTFNMGGDENFTHWVPIPSPPPLHPQEQS